MGKVYNWGIIGLGHIAEKFAADIGVIPNAKLHAVASRTAEKALAFGNKYNAIHTFGSYEELMACPDLDAVYIATPHPWHCENTLMCLEHNIPVLCEKPFAMNSKEVRKMVGLAKFQNTFLMEALWTRFLPTTQKVLDLIAVGAIGDINTVKADFGFKANMDPKNRLFNQGLGGGALLDVGIYPIFLACSLLGKPTSISAEASIGPTNVDENCGMLLKFPNNKLAILHASIISKTKTEALIYGDKGIIQIHGRWHEPTSITLYPEDGEPQDFFFDFDSNGYKYEILEVQECLKKGLIESPEMSFDFSIDLMEVLDDVRMKAGIYYPMYDHFTDKEIATKANNFSQN